MRKKAEAVGFEPTDPLGSAVFKTAAFDHSATDARIVVYILELVGFEPTSTINYTIYSFTSLVSYKI